MLKKDDDKIELPKLKSIYNTIVNTTVLNVKTIKDSLKKQEKKSKKKFFIIFSIIVFSFILLFIYAIYPPKIYSVTYSNKISNNNTQQLIIKFKTNKIIKTKCSLNGNKYIESKNNTCSFDVKTGVNNIYIKKLLFKRKLSELVDVKGVKSVKLESEKYYLALNESIKLNADIDYIGDADTSLTWISSNPEIVSVEDGIIAGLKEGESFITVKSKNNNIYTTQVIVTDLISKMVLDNTKSVVPCNKYTEEEALVLDDILSTRIKIKGEKTRAALIETVRFITLSFKYKVPYFFENGRLVPYGKMKYVDGEGRYYHKGLYLSNSKKESIKASLVGPSIWGCPLTNFDDLYGWTVGAKYPNGLDCSGFVSWALYNAGIDVGDIGAGLNENIDDISDLGKMHKLTYDYVNSKEYKVGDLIGWDGHIAIIAGLDNEFIYIAESLAKGVKINKLNYTNKWSKLYTDYTFINTLDEVYKSDGTYTDMWE